MSFYFGLLTGSLVGSGVGGHALRLVVLGPPDSENKARRILAVAGVALYSVAAASSGFELLWGPILSLIGPVIGLTYTLVTKNKVDTFQRVLGVFQILSALVGGYILLAHMVALGLVGP